MSLESGPGNTRPATLALLALALAMCWTLVGFGPPRRAGGEPPKGLSQFAGSSLGICFRLIPAGEFVMGDERNERGNPQLRAHKVWVDAFYIQETELTVEYFVICLNEMRKLEPQRADAMHRLSDRLPQWGNLGSGPAQALISPVELGRAVVCVTWEGACTFADWLSKRDGAVYRLPTEAEWEKAAKGGQGFTYSWGNQWDRSKLDRTARRPNRLGIWDMTGGVAEWCLDWYDPDYYAVSPARNPRGPERPGPGQARVVRGCEPRDGLPLDGATFMRIARDSADSRLGFRLVREVPRPPDPEGAESPPAGPKDR